MTMWDNFMQCLKHGGKAKGCIPIKISDIYSRVPPDQRKQFQLFAAKTEQYKIRLRKNPASLPNIDWDYYKKNVREEYVSWVEEFKKKYDNLDTVFGNRHTVIDHTKYFGDLIKETELVTKSIAEFKKESNDRIKCFEHKIEYLKNLKSYNEMTMEEYCFAHPKSAPDFRNKPTFWPHTEDEQTPGPIEVHHPEAESPKPKDPKSKGDGEKSPPGTPPSTPPATPPATGKPKRDRDKPPPATPPAKPSATAAPAAKKEAEKQPQPKAVVKVEKKEEGQAIEMLAQYAVKSVELAKGVASKLRVMVQGLLKKSGGKKACPNTTSAEKPKAVSKAATTKPKKDDFDDDLAREGSPSICHKTIIRGEDTAIADIKKKHENLDIETDSECPKKEKKRNKCKDEEEEDICDSKPKKCIKLNPKKDDDDATKCQAQNIEDKRSFTETQFNSEMGKSTLEVQAIGLDRSKFGLVPKKTETSVVQSGTDPFQKSKPIETTSGRSRNDIESESGSKSNVVINSHKLTDSTTTTQNLRILPGSERKKEKSTPTKVSSTKDKSSKKFDQSRGKEKGEESKDSTVLNANKLNWLTKTENLRIFPTSGSIKSKKEKSKLIKPTNFLDHGLKDSAVNKKLDLTELKSVDQSREENNDDESIKKDDNVSKKLESTGFRWEKLSVEPNNVDSIVLNSNKLNWLIKTENLQIFPRSESIKTKTEKSKPISIKNKPTFVEPSKKDNKDTVSKVFELTELRTLDQKAKEEQRVKHVSKPFDVAPVTIQADESTEKSKPISIKNKPTFVEPSKKDNKDTVSKVFELTELRTLDQKAKEEQRVKHVSKPFDVAPVTIQADESTLPITSKQQDVGGKSEEMSFAYKEGDSPKRYVEESENMGSDEMAKQMFQMATKSATLLSEAKKVIDEAKVLNPNNVKLSKAYEAAEAQVARALNEAYNALSVAKQLTKRAETNIENGNQQAVLLIEKHAMLAKLLAQRALTMKKEITTILKDLKKD